MPGEESEDTYAVHVANLQASTNKGLPAGVAWVDVDLVDLTALPHQMDQSISHWRTLKHHLQPWWQMSKLKRLLGRKSGELKREKTNYKYNFGF